MRFGLLGPVTIAHADACASIGRSQRRGLLGYLLLHHGRWISADALTEALWGGAEPASARQQIQTSVHAIRSELRRLGTDDMVEGGGSGYRLELVGHELDLTEFIDLVQAARRSARGGDFEQGERHLLAALDLWRGTALADASGAYVESARAGLADQRISATEDLLAVRLALGRHTEVLATIGPLLLTYPLRERLRGQQMLALYREGRQVDALEAFRAFRDLLVDEHGLDPHPDLQALERAILAGDPALDRPARVAVPYEPGDPEPAAPFELVDPAPPTLALRAEAGAAAVRVRVPAQLPAAASAFVGRTAELEKLDRALALGRAEQDRPTAVLINTVDGAGGVGKTATAVTWAHRIRDQFPDGQLYVNMHGYSTMPPVQPLAALAWLLDAVGVAPEQIPTDLEAAASLYRTRLHGQRMLILIDNVNDVDQVRPLLPGHAGCLVLVTSRARLTGLIAREGARRVSLGGLSPDESRTLLARIVGDDRVAAEPAAAAEIARACAYLPLALRIVAANLYDRPEVGLAEYAVTLAKAGPLDALEIDGDPQASVRIALAQSYGALTEQVRRLFRLLGLVPGPEVTAGMAAALAGTSIEEAAAGLERLLHSHLVDEVRPGRYGLHDLVRFFARERAAEEESIARREVAQQRLFQHYLGTLGTVARRLYPQFVRLDPEPVSDVVDDVVVDPIADEPTALAWADSHMAGLVSAVRWGAGEASDGTGDCPSLALARAACRLADLLRGFFWVRRRMTEWLDTAQAGYAAANRLHDPKLIAAAALGLGLAYRTKADYQRAAIYLEEALKASRTAGWVEAEASVLGSLAVVHAELAENASAVRYFTEALELNRRIGRRAGEAVVQGNLASLRLRMGELPEAMADSLAALELYRGVGAIGGEAIVLTNLALGAQARGSYHAAIDYAARSLELHDRIGDQYGGGLALTAQAMAQVDLGNLDEALATATLARDYAEQSEDRSNEATTHIVVGAATLAAGDAEQALGEFRQSVALAGAVGSRHAESEASVGVARALMGLGRPAEALTEARQGLEIARRNGLLLFVGQALTAIAAALVDLDRLDDAREHVHEALVVHRASGHRPGEARTLVVLGHIEAAAGRAEAAARAWTEAEAMLAEMGAMEAVRVRALLST